MGVQLTGYRLRGMLMTGTILTEPERRRGDISFQSRFSSAPNKPGIGIHKSRAPGTHLMPRHINCCFILRGLLWRDCVVVVCCVLFPLCARRSWRWNLVSRMRCRHFDRACSGSCRYTCGKLHRIRRHSLSVQDMCVHVICSGARV